ncbi:MAG: hypothetical protein PWP52_1394, partial [Bacteroidales bacterium]|nr:hypothetical protein [Bacteroidales bacterium]
SKEMEEQSEDNKINNEKRFRASRRTSREGHWFVPIAIGTSISHH